MSIFEQASYFTLDENMKKMLVLCGKNKFPPQFKLSRNVITTAKGNKYDIPKDPMDLYNLIHDIMYGVEPVYRVVAESATTRRTLGIDDDAITAYADRHAKALGKDHEHAEKIASCIYTALYLNIISPEDITYDNRYIVSIDGIDVSEPRITRNR